MLIVMLLFFTVLLWFLAVMLGFWADERSVNVLKNDDYDVWISSTCVVVLWLSVRLTSFIMRRLMPA